MLQIRKGQLDDIHRTLTLTLFEDEMVSHFRELAPRRCALFGEAGLRSAIRFGCSTAGELGFTKRGPVKLVLELAFTHGSSFATDPLHDWGDTLRASASDLKEMARAELLRQSALTYSDVVLGVNGVAIRRALHRFHSSEIWSPPSAGLNLDEQILATMRDVYPERWSYLGEPRLRAFIRSRRGGTDGSKALSPQVVLTEVWLAYWAGSGFADDPLFPWAEPASGGSRSLLGEDRARTLALYCRRYTEAMMQDWERMSHDGTEHA